MNFMLIGDIHIQESAIPEINTIFDELLVLKDKHCISKVLLLGDTFDTVDPSPKELDCFSTFIRKLNCPIVLLAANSHESISETVSVINHFSILRETILVTKEYKDNNHLYLGHFTLKESKLNYGSTHSKKEFEQYKYVILGHQHSFELISPNICHLGSIRYVDFAESKDEKKQVLIIENYKDRAEKCNFVPLFSPIPMLDVIVASNVEPTQPNSKIEAQTCTSVQSLHDKLNKLDKNTKVRCIFKDFAIYKEFLPLYAQYKAKFVVFKDRKDFTLATSTNQISTTQIDLKTSMKNYLVTTKVDDIVAKAILDTLEE